jgi:peptidoglycan-associated lipoprotein
LIEQDTITPDETGVIIHPFSSLHGQTGVTGVPIMHFEERVIDFGPVKKGEKRSTAFTFTNKGDAPLQIDIITSCDCTTLEYDAYKTYAVGESGTISVVFDSTEKDASETDVDIDIILKNTFPGTDIPILERLQYTFQIVE